MMKPQRREILRRCTVFWGILTLFFAAPGFPQTGEAPLPATGPLLPAPILFVTQVPIPADFTTIGSVFGNHKASMYDVGRGGDLWIRYADGTLKNLTAAAGYGTAGLQGAGAIAVRDPAVHWDATKAVFSMVVGAPTQQYQVREFRWQLYEITGLGQHETPVITKVPGQPAQANNVSPTYGTDDRILFTSDLPRNGAPHLYPQLDEYELAPSTSGLWSLDPTTGAWRLLDHAPSGDFTPIVDSFGRVIFTRWDHLQRDQQADADANFGTGQHCDSGSRYGTFNYADESPQSVALLGERREVFPEPRACRGDLLQGSNLAGHAFNHFFPWQINEDGTEAEVLNHLGRHELHAYFDRSLTDDANLEAFYGQVPRYNPNPIQHMLQVKEAPARPGTYYGTDAPEFATHAAGQIVRLYAPPSRNADQIRVSYVTHPDTRRQDDTPGPHHSGLYREPLPLSDGTLLAVHTATTRADTNLGTRAHPQSRYAFRLTMLSRGSNGYYAAAQPLTPGIPKTIRYWDPDVLVTYDGPLWELNPVEVRPRPRPARRLAKLPAIERQVVQQAGVDLATLRAYLVEHNLALVVSRNVTTRDDNDIQQPFNLRVASGGTQTIGASGTMYEVSHLQFFQGDQLRGWTGGYSSTPRAGRRVLAQPLHDLAALASNPPASAPLPGSVTLGSDGSMAAFVPAQRAMTWQLTDPQGQGVVRERYWLTLQPGEVRVCASCHGVNALDQAGNTAPTNAPEALRNLLLAWKAQQEQRIFADDFESGGLAGWTASPGATPAVTAAAALEKHAGLAVTVAGGQVSFLTDTSPAAETHYTAQFLFDPNTLGMPPNRPQYIFTGSHSQMVFRVELQRLPGAYQLRAAVRDNSGAWTFSPWAALADTAHVLQVAWQAAAAPGTPDGALTLWVDGQQQASLTGIANETHRLHHVRLGAVAGVAPDTQGTMYFDAFRSWRP